MLRDETPLRLTPRDIEVLTALVERHGEIVDKSRLLEQVWQGANVDECNLAQHVAGLRRTLGDDARRPAYIETVPRRGYRFVAPVTLSIRSTTEMPPRAAVPPAEAPPSSAPTPAPAPSPLAPVSTAPVGRRSLAWRVAPVLLALLGALGGGWAIHWGAGRTAPPDIHSIAVLPFANLTGDSQHDEVADTLTNALTRDLALLTGMRVERRARSPEPGDGGRAVDGVVEAALLDNGGHVMLAAGLVDTRTNRLVWAETFESDSTSFDKVEQRIAKCIQSRLLGLPEEEEEEELE